MKYICLLITALIMLSGCVAATVNPTTYAIKAIPRHELQPKAEAGDPVAQYELGKSWCCLGLGFDTQIATEWLCKAARQNNADAQYELGRIYHGSISRTMVPGQKLRRLLLAKSSPAHAHLWLERAEDAGHEKAAALLDKIEYSMSDEDRAIAAELAPNWQRSQCEYNDVFPS